MNDSAHKDMPPDRQPCEDELRGRLGVPVDAAQVIVATESTNWDPN